MKTALRLCVIVLGSVWIIGLPGAVRAVEHKKPNIVLILADDLGYGDPGCFNPKSKMATPHVDGLAKKGMRFLDAHAPGSVCVPSRYGLITGRYPFRNAGIRNPNKGALLEAGRVTLAQLLRAQGYATAMVGKWHLGFEGGIAFDYAKPLRGGPVDHGFEYFFGQHASLDIPPYFYIEGARCVQPADKTVAASSSAGWSPIQGAFWREGKIASDYKHDMVLSTYTQKAVKYIEGRAKNPQPFFLYLALTAPHTPWLPAKESQGKSKAGMYGDFVTDMDNSVGQVLEALAKAGLDENTLVIFTSDNGPTWYPADVARFGHSAAGLWRGMKGDAWEGGHRVPFIVRWSGRIKEGSESTETICFTDLLATFAALAGGKVPAQSGEDSFDFSPVLFGEKTAGPLRPVLITESSKGVFTVRQGPWTLIPTLGSAGFSPPAKIDAKPGDPAGQRYDLAKDPGQSSNLYAREPDVVRRLTELLEKAKREGRTR